MAFFLQMDYIKAYMRIILNRKENPLPKGVYVERHHIVPKSEGGSNKRDNLVKLTAREHYVAHLLLAKIYDDSKMYCAALCMQKKNRKHQRNFRFNSRLYEAMRKKFSESMLGKMSGENGPTYGMHWYNNGVVSVMTKECPPGFVPGNLNNSGEKNPNYGKKHSEEWKEYMREKLGGEKNPNYGKTGEQASFFGKHHTESALKKISDAAKLRTGENHNQYGTHWYTNGVVNVMRKECPEGFVPGHIGGRRTDNAGTHWYNNGEIAIQAKECPEGFVPGRLKKKAA